MSDLVVVEELCVAFGNAARRVRVVDDVGFSIREGETLALVGESGCGKSVTALSLLRLLPEPPARIERGRVWLGREDLLAATPARLRALRGRRIAMIFQEPMTSLDPVFRIGEQIEEVLRLHERLDDEAARERTLALLDDVGIPAARTRIDEYPHQLSGGMRQRVMIAMALACRPSLLIADEPTTALDVTVQAQILDLLSELQRRSGMAILLITHDLGVVARLADRVAVMYAGRIVEEAPTHALFANPRHPYTAGLLRSVPRLDRPDEELIPIAGQVPEPRALPRGCAFEPRCPVAGPRCARERPARTPILPATQFGVGERAASVACFVASAEFGDGEARVGESPPAGSPS